MTASICVLMSVRNGMPYLPLAVESILAQSFSDFEMLVLDDRSTDETRPYLQQLKDPRIRVVTSPAEGQTKSLNAGIQLTNASWIARMDSDDWSAPDRLAKQWAAIRNHPEALFVSADYWVCNEALQPVGLVSLNVDDPGFLVYARQKQNPFCHPAMMFKRQAAQDVGGYPDHLRAAQDYALWLALLKRGSFAHVPEPLLKYRLHTTAVSIQNFQIQQAHRDEILGVNGVDRAKATSREGLYAYRLGFAAWLAGDRKRSIPQMWKAICLRTRWPQAAAAILLSVLPRKLYLSLTGYDHVYR